MDILVHSHRAPVTQRLRELVFRRLRYALDRHAQHIVRVQVWLSEVGLHNGAGERCRIVIACTHAGTIVVEETCENMPKAVSKAADSAERAVRRGVEKRRSSRRSRAVA